MSLDGTWRRTCIVEDVSDSGARLTVVDGALAGLSLKEFFLVLSANGKTFRRCELGWLKGQRLGVSFVKQTSKSKVHAWYAPT